VTFRLLLPADDSKGEDAAFSTIISVDGEGLLLVTAADNNAECVLSCM
jgi:hypothetical protein